MCICNTKNLLTTCTVYCILCLEAEDSSYQYVTRVKELRLVSKYK